MSANPSTFRRAPNIHGAQGRQQQRKTARDMSACVDLLLGAIGYPSRHRGFARAVLDVAPLDGSPFARSHTLVAEYMMRHGTKDGGVKTVSRELAFLRKFIARTGYEFLVARPGGGKREDGGYESTVYVEQIIPAAQWLMRESNHAMRLMKGQKVNPTAVRKRFLAQAVELIPRVSITEADGPQIKTHTPEELAALNRKRAIDRAREGFLNTKDDGGDVLEYAKSLASEILQRALLAQGLEGEVTITVNSSDIPSSLRTRGKPKNKSEQKTAEVTFEPRAAIWRNKDHDQPVMVTGELGEKDGQIFYAIEGSNSGIPESELEFEDESQPTPKCPRYPPATSLETADTNSPCDKVAAALEAARRGFKVFPAHTITTEGACSCGDAKCGNPGKHPISKGWQAQATRDPSRIRELWSKYPWANIGGATGQGIQAVDVDPRHGGDISLTELIEARGELPETLAASTGSGGFHLYFAHAGERIGNTKGRLGEGIDTRGDGGLVILPGSDHASGRPYKWLNDVPLAPLPYWILSLLTSKQQIRRGATVTDIRTRAALAPGEVVPEGERNETLFRRVACSMRARGAEYDEIEARLLEVNSTQLTSPLPMHEIQTIARSACSYPAGTRPVTSNEATPTITAAELEVMVL
ncbi:MAG TPA: bifunctional DNA primase/polymerase [Pyrinomonadaceae bacterium]